ncbi:DUF929 domain-containing protein [Acidianus sulfidivorans JP7]|uniref:DUF929 domain-containing protein n=1 Tax=Acidianus sulfidivorans JP7 TaxID=619593 RepID=A0A2U9IJQ1_9CREN|nr:DUF929 domain-containing protein [Acidianus sulfidivorans]AWR96215.1 DUF929 domain-containing protein [Acidianus sulfidivorans JP7]
MAKRAKKRKQQQQESKLIYVPFIILAVILVAIFVIPSISHKASAASDPFFQFSKVSNQDFASGNNVNVYLISWYGCPLGATNSWGLYLALSHYGIVNASPNYSDVEQLSSTYSGKDPGLLFYGFTPNSTVNFYPIYILGRIYTNNGTASLPNGTFIPISSIIPVEESELQSELPSGLYNIVYQYELNENMPNQNEPIAFLGHPAHITTMVIITGPKGTWLLIGYPETVVNNLPVELSQSGYSPTQIFQAIKSNDLSSLSSSIANGIQSEANYFLKTINQA